MVGGGKGSFIGEVHRMAARLDDRYELIAGASAPMQKLLRNQHSVLIWTKAEATRRMKLWRKLRVA